MFFFKLCLKYLKETLKLKAGVIISSMSILWKLIISDIPLPVATFLTLLTLGGCGGFTMFFYATLSFCRLCILHEFEWFMDIDQRKLYQRIWIITLLIFFLYGIPRYLFIYHKFDHVGYTLFLTSIRQCSLNQLTKNVTRHPFVITCILLSFIMEVYIAIKLKKLPWSTLRSITIGHIIMTIGVFASSMRVSKMGMYGVKMPLMFLMFQLLYLLKYRKYANAQVRQLCIITPRRINPVDDDLNELNDFGVFIGHQKDIYNIPDLESDTNVTNEFGNVYIRDENHSNFNNKEINNIISDPGSNQNQALFDKELVLSAKAISKIDIN